MIYAEAGALGQCVSGVLHSGDVPGVERWLAGLHEQLLDSELVQFEHKLVKAVGAGALLSALVDRGPDRNDMQAVDSSHRVGQLQPLFVIAGDPVQLGRGVPGGKKGYNAKRMQFDDGKWGVKYSDPNGGMGGIIGPDGRVVSFWYDDDH